MLERLTLRDFKSFQHAEVPLDRLTLLVGANASGKSNLFDAIRFLQGVGSGLTFVDIVRGRWEGGREVWPGLRGGASELARVGGGARFSVETSWRLEGRGVRHAVEVALAPHPALAGERLEADELGAYLFDTHAPTLGSRVGLVEGGAVRVGLKSRGSGRNLSRSMSSARSLLGQIAPVERMAPEVLTWSSRVRDAMSAAIFLDIDPGRMRDYAPRSADRLGARGENISSVLFELCQREDTKRDVVDWLSELCAPEVEDIAFVETRLDDVMLQLVERGGVAISARSLSDGTLRFLGELTALMTAPRGSVMLIEEIENGLHPARVHLLVELLTGFTRDTGVQVIATTHSPSVLEALARIEPELLRSVIVCGRAPDAPGTVARPLGSLPAFDDVVARRGIEHLFATNWMERAL